MANSSWPEELEDLPVPYNWEHVKLFDHYSGEPKDWCDNQGWKFGIDYYFVITDKHPAFTTEWGRFKVSSNRVYNYLFKSPKNATIFRLRWS